ncbi:hypothetical protein LEP1GSC151_0773 [Leptospira interrogans serovar Grippotyphosa str. LT2186]|uniref:Uncharacterized protein n=1 Tax=Leptospira interrogans serovar Grippotyphosa str. LT2186 TaxID=1001599 RepID=M3H778_LEPIR|nr:hypothetical protein LEP1GSC151_0773 [Leptospira interrogans serovar Grippotyphosa str. LT2186]
MYNTPGINLALGFNLTFSIPTKCNMITETNAKNPATKD